MVYLSIQLVYVVIVFGGLSVKEVLQKYGPLLFILILITCVCLNYSHSKSGMFIDEIYTYGLSNSSKGAFLRDCIGGTLENQVVSRQDFLDYVSVQPGERFSFLSVYNNQAADVHPPLYYWLFHIVSSLMPGVFSKWTGLVLDLFLYLGTLILLYLLLRELFESQVTALAGVVIYGLSQIGLSTMLMIRMYVLLTLLTVLLAWCVVKLMQNSKPLFYVLTCLTIFSGVMTQYYFVFYAFFLCALFVVYSLFKRDWKGTVLFAASALSGIGLLFICFPPVLDHLFANKLVSGVNALSKLNTPPPIYKEQLGYYFDELRHGLRAAVLIVPVLLVFLLVFSRRNLKLTCKKVFSSQALIVVLPAFMVLPLVALLSPMLAIRYIYNLCPIFVTAVAMLIAWLEISTQDIPVFKILKMIALGGLVLFCLWFGCRMEPSYQYLNHSDFNNKVSIYQNNPCVYLTADYNAPPTQDLIQLLTFEEVFIASSPESDVLKEYLDNFGGKDCILYIDVDDFWSSGFEPEEMLSRMMLLGYESYELLYSHGLSQCYLLINGQR